MLLVKALRYADQLHNGQMRKGGNREYIAHPVGCSYLLMKYKPSSHKMDELLAAMLLHDTLEDCDVSFSDIARETTPLVASLVLELTNDPEKVQLLGKFQYQLNKMKGMSSWGLTLKLIDMLYNISDNPSEKRKEEILEICEKLKKARMLSKTQNAIVSDILNHKQSQEPVT
jgi:(p)ppGpp synthase/HD superfamily hydrolase